MRTDAPIYFALLVLAALTGVALGLRALLIIVGLIVVVIAYMLARKKIKRPNEWRTKEYAVRIRGWRDAWVEYEEGGKTLMLRGEWGAGDVPDLNIWIEEHVYFPPDYKNALSEQRVSEIQSRVSEGLSHLNIRHGFTRLGWISFQ